MSNVGQLRVELRLRQAPTVETSILGLQPAGQGLAVRGIDQCEFESLCCESFGGEGIDRGFSIFVAHCSRVPGAADGRGDDTGVTMPR